MSIMGLSKEVIYFVKRKIIGRDIKSELFNSK